MKAAPFSYVRPTRLQDVVGELVAAQERGFGKVIAGGQSLMPVLAMRLSRPSVLVDINAVDELRQLTTQHAQLRVGAAVRQRQVEREVANVVPLVGLALPWVGHREIRSRGTVCGSLAHADPSAELPAVAECLGATIELVGPSGLREVPAAGFFTGAMTSAVGPTDLITAVRFPLPRLGEGFGFAEIARRHGDFAMVGIAVRVRTVHERIQEAVITAFGVADRPQTRDVHEELQDIVGGSDAAGLSTPKLRQGLNDLVGSFADEVVTTTGDINASTAYRRQLVRTLGAREIERSYRLSLKEAI